MRLARVTLIWAALAAAVCVPIAAAAASPLLAWRGPVYILAGFAGIVALGAHARSAFADWRILAGTVGRIVAGVRITGSEARWSWRW